MSSGKKAIRESFRNAVFKRDGYKCRVCGVAANDGLISLDAHHITDRNLMPAGGYVKENGISLCPSCHEKAEIFHSTGSALQSWSPNDLYELVGSSFEAADEASKKLEKQNAG